MLFAEVAVEAARGASEHETYTYSVPEALDVVPGQLVHVPFGRRRSFGYVVSLDTTAPDVEVKPIDRAVGEPWLLPHQVELARIISAHYWAPLIECLRAMLPPRVRTGKSTGEGPSSRQRRHSLLLEIASAAHSQQPGPPPTPDQRRALDAIASRRRVLLHGVTGSGKTEVYLRAIDAALEEGLRAMVLVPEISLTPQLVEIFARRLPGRIAVLHSQLTGLERAQQWWRLRRGQADVVIGSRSAVFAPIPKLGLICVDEEGSSAYKQDRVPRYEAGWVARRLAELTGARLILGSATPSVATFHEADGKQLQLVQMPRRIRGRQAEIELVDMREEAEAGNRMPLSRRLLEVVEAALEEREQVILFLNRRGSATFVLCHDCGRAVECPYCSVALVEHAELEGLACHYCGYSRALPHACPYCGSLRIRGLGMGTQRLQGAVSRLWPEARVLRLDSDTARGVDDYFEIFETFAGGGADILVGTQLVTKGFDLEGVSAVGVVDADLPLHFPDYRSAENTFALVTQVAGRAGRSGRPAHVVVQTSNPDHYSLGYAAAGDYRAFYDEEIAARAALKFPPFVDLAVLTYAHREDEKAAAAAREAAEGLASGVVAERLEGIRVLGPSPAFLHKLRNEYRWQITLKGHALERARHLAPRGKGWVYDVDPVS